MRCPITYEVITDQDRRYSQKGLSLLSKNITDLKDFSYTRNVQIGQTQVMGATFSLQGMQARLNVTLNSAEEIFEIAETASTFIIKPQNILCSCLPENEDLTMRLAKLAGIEVPIHGLVYCKDGSLSYWMRRFDRPSLKSPGRLKFAVEDFAQLSGINRKAKYQGTMEKVAGIIETYATFPLLEKEKLFRLTLFNFLVGNKDVHLKSFSFLTENQMVKLGPAYDLINTHIAMGGKDQKEIALPLNNKTSGLRSIDFIDYFAIDFLKLPQSRIKKIVKEIILAAKKWPEMIHVSFLAPSLKEDYVHLVNKRLKQLLS